MSSENIINSDFPELDVSIPNINPRELSVTNKEKINTSNNIPSTVSNTDSAQPVKTFFDKYFVEPISIPAGEIDAVIGFFEKRNFEKTAAVSVSTILLQQAKLDNVKIFQLLDTLKGLNDLQLSNIVAQILNVNRSKISTLGFKVVNNQNQFEKRNIVV